MQGKNFYTKQTEALKLALEALTDRGQRHPDDYKELKNDAITAIREALAEQPAQQQEPVAYMNQNGVIHPADYEWEGVGNILTPLYTSPPASKPWVGLTDEEIYKMTVLMGINPNWKPEMEIVRSVVRNLEAKLREKNA